MLRLLHRSNLGVPGRTGVYLKLNQDRWRCIDWLNSPLPFFMAALPLKDVPVHACGTPPPAQPRHDGDAPGKHPSYLWHLTVLATDSAGCGGRDVAELHSPNGLELELTGMPQSLLHRIDSFMHYVPIGASG